MVITGAGGKGSERVGIHEVMITGAWGEEYGSVLLLCASSLVERTVKIHAAYVNGVMRTHACMGTVQHFEAGRTVVTRPTLLR